MQYEEFSEKVKEWADEKGIFQKSNPLRQLDKTQEELDETRRALNMLRTIKSEKEEGLLSDQDYDYWMNEVKDGIGDMMVTIIILAKMVESDSVDCLQMAYNVIKNRTGKMVNGYFVKDV
jgi:NTP pyrophosphatase (non-canonical NTP hydrolase)